MCVLICMGAHVCVRTGGGVHAHVCACLYWPKLTSGGILFLDHSLYNEAGAPAEPGSLAEPLAPFFF